jgi:acetyltransferase-like isoleucine patch superfamily enzyme
MVTIEGNCWIGASTLILPNLLIQKNIIVGAGSVVTKSLSRNSIYVGVPAMKIKDIKGDLSIYTERTYLR